MARVLLHKCTGCSEYTMQTATCPSCGGKVAPARPAKYSPEDHYGEYRRRLKKLEKESDGKR